MDRPADYEKNASNGISNNHVTMPEEPRKQGHCGPCTRLLLCLTLFFFVTTATAVLILIWREISRNKPEDNRLTDELLRKAYPGYFRSEDEQEEYIERLLPPIPVSRVVDLKTGYCSVYCTRNVTSTFDPTVTGMSSPTTPIASLSTSMSSITTPVSTISSSSISPFVKTNKTQNATFSRSKRSPRNRRKKTYHGCCVSEMSYAVPFSKKNLDGEWKTLVGLDGSMQFFRTQKCSKIKSCKGCTCELERELNTAVVYKTGVTVSASNDLDDIEIDTFYFDGCCKCINTG